MSASSHAPRPLAPDLSTLLSDLLRPVAGSIYHYTDTQGMLGMVSSGQFWASEASSLNDKAEVRQGWELIKRLLADYPPSQGRALLEGIANGHVKDGHDVFVLSASTAGDDASQWRLYADGSRGYCLEVDAGCQLAVYSDDKGVEDVEPPSSKSWGSKLGHITNVTSWQHVMYEQDEVSRVLGGLTDWADLQMAQIADVGGAVCEDDTRLEDLENEVWKGLTTIAHLVKSPGFSGEHEVRTVATFLVGDAHIRYRAGFNGIVGYTSLTWDRDGSGSRVLLRSKVGETFVRQLPLKSIRIGPLLPEEQVVSVRRFLRLQRMQDVKVELSEVPLR